MRFTSMPTVPVPALNDTMPVPGQDQHQARDETGGHAHHPTRDEVDGRVR